MLPQQKSGVFLHKQVIKDLLKQNFERINKGRTEIDNHLVAKVDIYKEKVSSYNWRREQYNCLIEKYLRTNIIRRRVTDQDEYQVVVLWEARNHPEFRRSRSTLRRSEEARVRELSGFDPEEEPVEFTVYHRIQVEIYRQLLYYFFGLETLNQDDLSAARDQTLDILRSWCQKGQFASPRFGDATLYEHRWLSAEENGAEE